MSELEELLDISEAQLNRVSVILRELKTKFNLRDKDRCVDLIKQLFIIDKINFRKNLLFAGFIPEPLMKNYKEDSLNFLIEVFSLVAYNVAKEKMEFKEFDFYCFLTEYIQITGAILALRQNYKSNLERLEKNDFIHKYSIQEQLQLYCIYFESQMRLANNKIEAKNKGNTRSSFISSLPMLDIQNGTQTISAEDLSENLLEALNGVFGYLYSVAGVKLENNFRCDLSAFKLEEDNSIVELIMLCIHRNMLNEVWGKFKYDDWQYQMQKDEDIDYYLFESKDEQKSLVKSIAIERYSAKLMTDLNFQVIQDPSVFEATEFLKKKIAKVNNFDDILLISRTEYFKISVYTRRIVEMVMDNIDEVYLKTCRKDDKEINIPNVFILYEYLLIISFLYSGYLDREFDKRNVDNIHRLNPIIGIDTLANHFASIYKIDIDIANKLVDLFIYSPNKKRNELDLYFQPLVYVGRSKIIFNTFMIMIMNLQRCIETLATQWDKQVAEKGATFESELVSILSLNPFINVNTEKIEFEAFDGKKVEFDFIATFQDYLLLLELKHIKPPYLDKEKLTSERTIKKCAKQVIRRTEIIQKQWDEIRSRAVGLDLPEKPYSPEKIIKLVCVNIFDFTSLVIEGVRVIDSSCLMRFFMAPHTDVGVFRREKTTFVRKDLWEKDYPTVKEFLTYIDKPAVIIDYEECFRKEFRPIPLVKEGDENILFKVNILYKSPAKKYLSNKKAEPLLRKFKVGRNDTCPCGSGKKYKKCCGINN